MKKLLTVIISFLIFSTINAQKIVEKRLISGDATITKEIKLLNVPDKKINNRIFRDGTIVRIVVKDFEASGKVIKVYVVIGREEYLVDRFYSQSLQIARLKDENDKYSYIIYDDEFSYCILTYESIENISGYVLYSETKPKN